MLTLSYILYISFLTFLISSFIHIVFINSIVSPVNDSSQAFVSTSSQALPLGWSPVISTFPNPKKTLCHHYLHLSRQLDLLLYCLSFEYLSWSLYCFPTYLTGDPSQSFFSPGMLPIFLTSLTFGESLGSDYFHLSILTSWVISKGHSYKVNDFKMSIFSCILSPEF